MATAKSIVQKIKNRKRIFFPKIKKYLLDKFNKEQEAYSWESIGYKLYPSSFPETTMCPKHHIEITVHSDQYRTEDILFSMAKGSAVHEAYQKIALEMEDFLYDNFNFEELKQALTEEQFQYYTEKYRSSLPEIYVWEPSAHVCGKIDFVLKDDLTGEPIVLDLKTMTVENTTFNKERNTFETGLWESKKTKLPEKYHKLQVNIYGYIANKYNLFGRPVTRVGILADNMAVKGESGSEEFLWDFTENTYKVIDELMRALAKCRNEYIQGKEVVCDYKLCKQHAGVSL
jgi:hypothetical protein